jgi:hypothetical protein
MTAINIIGFPAAVHLAVDGFACLERNGGSQSFLVNKTYVAAHLPLVVACRGGGNSANWMGSALAREYETFDDLIAVVEKMSPLLHECRRASLSNPELPVHQNTEIFLLAWSARRAAAEAYRIRVGEADYAPYPAWTLQAIDVCWAPWPPQFRDAVPEGKDVSAMMLSVMEVQRADFPGEIGGFCKLVTVTEDRIVARILRRWPDAAPVEPRSDAV